MNPAVLPSKYLLRREIVQLGETPVVGQILWTLKGHVRMWFLGNCASPVPVEILSFLN